QTASGTRSISSAIRVIDSARASAARSASVKNGASRHTATAARRCGVSSAFEMPMSTQTAQPLIWLTRRCTSSRVTGGMGPLETMAPSVTRGCTASCMTATGSLILACMVRVLRPDDGSRGAGVTEKDDVELGERVGLHDDVEGDDPFAGDREHERGAHVATRR